MTREDLRREYRLPEITTQERIEGSDGEAAIFYGRYLIKIGYYYECGKPCYFTAIYEALKGTKPTCETELYIDEISEDRFEDAGHAMAWGIERVTTR
jgi:hypothetical protein